MIIINDTMHSSSAFLIYNLFYWLFLHTNPPPFANFLICFFGIFPDLDGIYWSIKNKGKKHETSFQHHLNSWFHWPIRWFWLIIPYIIAMIFNFYPEFFIIPFLGIYVHLIGDSISCGDGMMWLHGWTIDKVAKYYNFWSSKTDGYHGNYWSARYKHTIFYKFEILFGLGVIALNIWYIFLNNLLDLFTILIILYILASILFTANRDLAYYENEPPEGRYADYRKNKSYLSWMKENNYEFNKEMKLTKKK